MSIVAFIKNKFSKIKNRLSVLKVPKIKQKDQETASYLSKIWNKLSYVEANILVCKSRLVRDMFIYVCYCCSYGEKPGINIIWFGWIRNVSEISWFSFKFEKYRKNNEDEQNDLNILIYHQIFLFFISIFFVHS